MRVIFWFILINTVMKINCTIWIGHISNVTHIPAVADLVITYQTTCSECICKSFFSAEPFSYVGLNCYRNNKTCCLFAHFSSSTVLKEDFNSIFLFTELPPSSVISTGEYASLTFLKVSNRKRHQRQNDTVIRRNPTL